MRRQFSLKSKTYTEGYVVDVAGISVKAVRITRGGLRTCYELLSSRGDEKSLEKSAEVIVVPINRDEGQNLNLRKEHSTVELKIVIENQVQIALSHRGSIGRNPGVNQ